MALGKEKEKAIKMRLAGNSYSQIKTELGVAKSTLSGWLSQYPLSEDRIKALRDWNPRRIERCRNTKLRKRGERLESVYKKASLDIKKLSKRELFIAGLFLYWGEGLKTSRDTAGISNTDPSMIKFFMYWLKNLGIDKKQITLSVHLYADMDVEKEISFWLRQTNLPRAAFRGPYIKRSNISELTYKNGYGHGTCHIRIYSRDLSEYILMGLKYFKEMAY